MNDDLTDQLGSLAPAVLTVLVRRGADFAAAEDAVQEALISATQHWPSSPPADPKGWLITVAWRKLLDAKRSDASRRRREERELEEPPPGPTEQGDDTLPLLFLCCHPSLTASSAVALTLRAVGGLTTRQIASAYLVPEPTMAARITRAKKAIAGVRLTTPGSLPRVLAVLYLIFNEGYAGDVDLAEEAIRLTRQLVREVPTEPEVCGLLALMLLHHARRHARFSYDGSLVPLAEQDRSRWDVAMIGEGVEVLQAALARQESGGPSSLGEYQIQAAIAALHCDARRVEETDWHQILEWYDELAKVAPSPIVTLNRAVAVGEVDGPHAGLAALRQVPDEVPRLLAVRAHLHEQAGEAAVAAQLYAQASAKAGNAAERDHLIRKATQLRHHPAARQD